MIGYSKFRQIKKLSLEIFHTWLNLPSQQAYIFCSIKRAHCRTLLEGLTLGLVTFYASKYMYTGRNGKKIHTCTLEFIQDLNLKFLLTDGLGGKEAWRPPHFS